MLYQRSMQAMLGSSSSGGGARGGSLVLVSAAVASAGLPHFEAMSAAKAGVEGEESRHRPVQLTISMAIK